LSGGSKQVASKVAVTVVMIIVAVMQESVCCYIVISLLPLSFDRPVAAAPLP
jgi:hypothetical protein